MSVAHQITRRPGSDADREFLYLLLRRALGPHIEATYGPWDDAWQRAYFLEHSDPKEHQVLEVNGQPIGCLLLEERPEFLHLQRILLLPEYQNRGIGTQLVRELVATASSLRKSVKLQVFRVSPAVRFYERLGFRQVGKTSTHVLMQHAA